MDKISEKDKQLIEVVCDAMDEKSGGNIVLLSPGSASSVADHYVIAGAESEPQLRAMASFVERKVREVLQIRPLSEPSDSSSGWVLLDYGNVLVHMMTVEARERYDLEGLWGKNPAAPELLEKLQERKNP